MTDPQTHFQTITTMIENLRSDDREARLLSSRGIVLISHTLGPERTRSELIPYIMESYDDDDEVLCVTAQNFGRMLAEVGGPTFVGTLLQPLIQMSTMEEITVRMEVSAALNNISEQVFAKTGAGQSATADSQATVCGAILELCQSDQAQCRATAASLLEVPLRCGNPVQKREIKNAFQRLTEDGDVMVRRAACVALGTGDGLAKALHAFQPDALIPWLTRFAKDVAEGVKLQSIPAACALIPLVGDAAFTAVKNLSTDPGWRVRFMVADKIAALCQALAQTPNKDAVVKLGVPLFRSLLIDASPEIRASAVYNLDGVLQAVSTDDAKKDATVAACKLTTDSSPHVRQCIADVLLKTVAHTSRVLWDAHLIPACTSLLRDDDPQVRLGIVRSFAFAANAASSSTSSGINALDSLQSVAQALVPTVVALAKDVNWRVRELVLKQAAAVVQCLKGRSQDELLGACIGALTDRVASIRVAAVESIKALAQQGGPSFVQQNVLGTAANLIEKSGNYSHRVTWVQLVGACASVVGDRSFVLKELWPVLSKCASDKVPNVRMSAARQIKSLAASGKLFEDSNGSNNNREYESLIKKLEMDADVDVRDAASISRPKVNSLQQD
jgi:serine/threonine-protein phosphatase 2A regulatory subunit A